MGRFFFNTIIIINLQRRPDKLKKVLQRIYDLKLEDSVDIQVLSAVDGKELSDEWLKDNIRISPLYRDSMRGRGMTYGEIGCALSHMKAWETVKNSPSITQALIIEDDAVFKPNFLEVIERVKPGIENINYDFMYLSRKKMVEEKEPLVYSEVVQPYFSYWCLAYVLNKNGANKLLSSNFLQNMIPVDEFVPILLGTPNPGLRHMLHHYNNNKKLNGIAIENSIIWPEEFAFNNSDTEKSKVYFDNNFYDDGIDKFVVITVATEDNENLSRFKESCHYYNVPYIILGMGDGWSSGKAENGVLLEPGGAQKINYLKKELLSWEDLQDHIIMFTDSYDVVFNTGPLEIVTKFRQFGSPIVFSSEKTCWPDPEIESLYPEANTEYKYLNSGGFIGYGDHILKLISEDVENTEDDQRYYTNKFLNKPIPDPIKFDGINPNDNEGHENGYKIGWMSETYFDNDIMKYCNDNFSQFDRVLDIGAGDGKWGLKLGSYFHNVDAVEIFEPYIERYNLKEIYNEVHVMSFLDYEFEAGKYDIIVMGDVFEHVEKEKAYEWLNKVKDKVRELIIVVPFNYPQEWDGVYENVYGHHHQPDLTPKVMLERYPMLRIVKWTDSVSTSNEGEGFGWFGKSGVNETKHDIVLDYNQRIFQTLNLSHEDIIVDKTDGRVTNKVTNEEPCVLHANGPQLTKDFLKSITGYMFGRWNDTYGSSNLLDKNELEMDKRVYISVMLDVPVGDVNQVFDQIRYLTYPKNKIHLNFVYTDKRHEYKLHKFLNKFSNEYDGTSLTYQVGLKGERRNDALLRGDGYDYVLLMDCNYIFRNRQSIQLLISEDKEIVSPMIKEQESGWINFSFVTDESGNPIFNQEQTTINSYENRGCWPVGYSAGIWFIKSSVIGNLKNIFTEGNDRFNGDEDYDLIFSINCKNRLNTIYVSNNHYYGGIIS